MKKPKDWSVSAQQMLGRNSEDSLKLFKQTMLDRLNQPKLNHVERAQLQKALKYFKHIQLEEPEKEEESVKESKKDTLEFKLEVSNKHNQLLRSAISRNIDNDLNLYDVRRLLMQKTCYYTGHSFGKDENARTIDRIDPDKPYTRTNVVACLAWVNELKSEWFEDTRDNKKPLNFKMVLDMMKKLEKKEFKGRG